MDFTKTHELTTKFYGTSPAKGYVNILQKYIEGKIDDDLLTFAEKNKKKNQNIDSMVTDILSVFHRNGDDKPILGGWMLRKCLLNTGNAVFNAQKNKDHPKKDLIPVAITLIEPTHIFLSRDGKIVESPDGVDTYAVSAKKSFFKAYEYINPGARFTATYYFDEDVISMEMAEFWLSKAGQMGIGAFRERFGKFKIIP